MEIGLEWDQTGKGKHGHYILVFYGVGAIKRKRIGGGVIERGYFFEDLF